MAALQTTSPVDQFAGERSTEDILAEMFPRQTIMNLREGVERGTFGPFAPEQLSGGDGGSFAQARRLAELRRLRRQGRQGFGADPIFNADRAVLSMFDELDEGIQARAARGDYGRAGSQDELAYMMGFDIEARKYESGLDDDGMALADAITNGKFSPRAITVNQSIRKLMQPLHDSVLSHIPVPESQIEAVDAQTAVNGFMSEVQRAIEAQPDDESKQAVVQELIDSMSDDADLDALRISIKAEALSESRLQLYRGLVFSPKIEAQLATGQFTSSNEIRDPILRRVAEKADVSRTSAGSQPDTFDLDSGLFIGGTGEPDTFAERLAGLADKARMISFVMKTIEQSEPDPDRSILGGLAGILEGGSGGPGELEAGLLRGTLALPKIPGGILRFFGGLARAYNHDQLAELLGITGDILVETGKALESNVKMSDREGHPVRAFVATVANASPPVAIQVGVGIASGGAGIPAQVMAFAGTGVGPVVANQFNDALDYHMDNGMTRKQAEIHSAEESGAAGLITFATSLVPGVALFSKLPGGNSLLAAVARRLAISAVGEGVQEMSEKVLTDTMAALVRNDPLRRDAEYWRGVLYEGAVGAVLGMAGGGASEFSRGSTNAEPPGVDQAAKDFISNFDLARKAFREGHQEASQFVDNASPEILAKARSKWVGRAANEPAAAWFVDMIDTRLAEIENETTGAEASADISEQESAPSASTDEGDATEAVGSTETAPDAQGAETPATTTEQDGATATDAKTRANAEQLRGFAKLAGETDLTIDGVLLLDRGQLTVEGAELLESVRGTTKVVDVESAEQVEEPDVLAVRADDRGLAEDEYDLPKGVFEVFTPEKVDDHFEIYDSSTEITAAPRPLTWAEAVAEADRRNIEVSGIDGLVAIKRVAAPETAPVVEAADVTPEPRAVEPAAEAEATIQTQGEADGQGTQAQAETPATIPEREVDASGEIEVEEIPEDARISKRPAKAPIRRRIKEAMAGRPGAIETVQDMIDTANESGATEQYLPGIAGVHPDTISGYTPIQIATISQRLLINGDGTAIEDFVGPQLVQAMIEEALSGQIGNIRTFRQEVASSPEHFDPQIVFDTWLDAQIEGADHKEFPIATAFESVNLAKLPIGTEFTIYNEPFEITENEAGEALLVSEELPAALFVEDLGPIFIDKGSFVLGDGEVMVIEPFEGEFDLLGQEITEQRPLGAEGEQSPDVEGQQNFLRPPPEGIDPFAPFPGPGAADAKQTTDPDTPVELSIPASLGKPKPRFGRLELKFESDLDLALYIVAHSAGKRSKKDAEFLKLVKDSLGVNEAEARRRGDEVRARIKSEIKAGRVDHNEPGKFTVKAADAKQTTDPDAPKRVLSPELQAAADLLAARNKQRRAGGQTTDPDKPNFDRRGFTLNFAAEAADAVLKGGTFTFRVIRDTVSKMLSGLSSKVHGLYDKIVHLTSRIVGKSVKPDGTIDPEAQAKAVEENKTKLRLLVDPNRWLPTERRHVEDVGRIRNWTPGMINRAQDALGRLLFRLTGARASARAQIEQSKNGIYLAILNALEDPIAPTQGSLRGAGNYSGDRMDRVLTIIELKKRANIEFGEKRAISITRIFAKHKETRGKKGMAEIRREARIFIDRTSLAFDHLNRAERALKGMEGEQATQQQALIASLTARVEADVSAFPAEMQADIHKAFTDFITAINSASRKRQLEHDASAYLKPVVRRYENYVVVQFDPDEIKSAEDFDKANRQVFGLNDPTDVTDVLTSAFQPGVVVRAEKLNKFGTVIKVDGETVTVRFVNPHTGVAEDQNLPIDSLTPSSGQVLAPTRRRTDGVDEVSTIEFRDSAWWKLQGKDIEYETDRQFILDAMNSAQIAVNIKADTLRVNELIENPSVHFAGIDTSEFISGKRRAAVSSFFVNVVNNELGLKGKEKQPTLDRLIDYAHIMREEAGLDTSNQLSEQKDVAAMNALRELVTIIEGLEINREDAAALVPVLLKTADNVAVAAQLPFSALSVINEAFQTLDMAIKSAGIAEGIGQAARAVAINLRKSMTKKMKADYEEIVRDMASLAENRDSRVDELLFVAGQVGGKTRSTSQKLNEIPSVSSWIKMIMVSRSRAAVDLVLTGKAGKKNVPLLRQSSLDFWATNLRQVGAFLETGVLMNRIHDLAAILRKLQSGEAENPGQAIKQLRKEKKLRSKITPQYYRLVAPRMENHLERLAERLETREGVRRIFGMDVFVGNEASDRAVGRFLDIMTMHVDANTPRRSDLPLVMQRRGMWQGLTMILLKYYNQAMAFMKGRGALSRTGRTSGGMVTAAALMAGTMFDMFMRDVIRRRGIDAAIERFEEKTSTVEDRIIFGVEVAGRANLLGVGQKPIVFASKIALPPSGIKRRYAIEGLTGAPTPSAVRDIAELLFVSRDAAAGKELSPAAKRLIKKYTFFPNTIPGTIIRGFGFSPEFPGSFLISDEDEKKKKMTVSQNR